MRKRIQSFWANIGEIPNIYNSLLQTGFRKAGRSAGRLVINATIGLAGLFDPARRMGIERANEDLGQTLGYWGLGPGPYLVLPILGPSSLRDVTGLVGDVFAEREINFLGVRKAESEFDSKGTALFLIDAINQRDITDFRYGQTDSPFEYNIVRYLYTKQREIQIEGIMTERGMRDGNRPATSCIPANIPYGTSEQSLYRHPGTGFAGMTN